MAGGVATARALSCAMAVGLLVSCQGFVIPHHHQSKILARAEPVLKHMASNPLVARGTRPFCELSMSAANRMDRRQLIAGMLVLTVPVQSAVSVISKAPVSSPIVVEGQMRLEVGSDKAIEVMGGRANATVTLRCVGKGIISKTSLEIDVADFPPPGQPKPGESGGVPFFVTEADLNAKTEKGNVVNKAMWGDDDIFVRVDVTVARDGNVKQILKGIGKAKYVIGPDGVGYHQKPLVLLE